MTHKEEEEAEERLQKAMDELNKSYQEYKRNHPQLAKILEDDCEGKSDEQFNKQFTSDAIYHITTLTGAQADALIQLLPRDPSFRFKDKSRPGVSVLEIYSNINPQDAEYTEY